MKSKKETYWLHGGNKTPQYYCSKCDRPHTIHSKIGKEHISEMRVK